MAKKNLGSYDNFSNIRVYTRVGKTGSLGPWSRVIVYCSKLSFCQNDPPMGESFWQKKSLLQYTMTLLQGPKVFCRHSDLSLPLSMPLRSLVILHLTTHPCGVGSMTNASKLSSIVSRIPIPFSSSFDLLSDESLLPPPSAFESLPSAASPEKKIDK